MTYEEADWALEEEYDRSFDLPSVADMLWEHVYENAETLREDAVKCLAIDGNSNPTEAQIAVEITDFLDCNGRCDYALVLDNWDIYAKICKEQDWIIPTEPEEEREERICYAWN